MKRKELPEIFCKRMEKIFPENFLEILEILNHRRALSIRVNRLKVAVDEVRQSLDELNIGYAPVSWSEDAFIIEGQPDLSTWPFIQEGKVYIQSLASMLSPIVLNPKPGERVLDLCAAPGSKTTQMAAMMENDGEIEAVDIVKGRLYRLRAVIDLLGANIVYPRLMDGRRYRAQGLLFNKVLVDAPCSSESRFYVGDPKTLGYWSPRKIKEMAHKQKGLLLNASRQLVSGGELVYSTCTFAPEENESVVDWVLKKAEDLSLMPIDLPDIKRNTIIEEWNDRHYRNDLSQCLRVMPTPTMEGFFIAKFKKI